MKFLIISSRWYTYFCQSRSGSDMLNKVIELLSEEGFKRRDARLVLFDARVLLTLYTWGGETIRIAIKLVQSYPRLIFDIGDGCMQILESGYWSEPLLSNAAAVLLNDKDLNSGALKNTAPAILSDVLEREISDPGERAELVARTLLTVAHDEAILAKRSSPGSVLDDRLEFQQPISVTKFLRYLLHEDLWNEARVATPTVNVRNQMLEHVFANTYVNFTHWAVLAPVADKGAINARFAATLMRRGAAMRYPENQDYDLGIPLLHGGIDAELREENINICEILVEKRVKKDFQPYACNKWVGMKVDTGTDNIRPNRALPKLTLIFKWDVRNDGKRLEVKTRTTSLRGKQGHIEQHTWELTIFGCSSETYACMPKENPGSESLYFSALHV